MVFKTRDTQYLFSILIEFSVSVSNKDFAHFLVSTKKLFFITESIYRVCFSNSFHIFLIAEKDFRLCREVPARLGLRQEESLDERNGSRTSR